MNSAKSGGDNAKSLRLKQRNNTSGSSARVGSGFEMRKLEEYITRAISEARRCKRMAGKASAQSAVDYWSGHVIALVNLQRYMKRNRERV